MNLKKRKKLGRKLLSFLLTLAMLVGLVPGMSLTAYAAETPVTWKASDITGKSTDKSFTKDGITFAFGSGNIKNKVFNDGGTFTTESGKFTKIEVTTYFVDISGTDWSVTDNYSKMTWTGAASSSVSYSGAINGSNGQLEIVFTIETADATHSVTITPGNNMTKTETSGDAEQTGLTGAMTDVVYTADNGYYFPENYSVAAVNGISVTRNSYTQITVSGTPTADAEITLTAPTAKTTPDAPTTAAVTDCTTADNNDGTLTGVTTAMEYKKSDAAEWTAGTGSNITGLVPGTYYVRLKATDTTNASAYQELTIAEYTAPTYTVTYKVVNGTWSDDSTADKTETVQSGSKPASVPTGMKAASGYTGGAWDTNPAEATITGATTFTYTFTALPSYQVTYKVVNGTWSDYTTTDKTETVQHGSKPASVPTGMKAASGYTGGAWDTDPTGTTITGATTFTYTFTAKQTVATPAFSPVAGTYTEAQSVTISCATEGATIHYTTDGNDPTSSSTTYSSAISIGETTTIKAIAVKDGMTDSEVASATYTINIPKEKVATPAFSPEAGTYTEAQNVTISCATEGATIHYTTDGNDPTSSSTTYSSAISVGETTTIKAIAVKDGMTDSEVASAEYTINIPKDTVATPTFSPDAGEYEESTSVTISCATDGATIYYTTDGTLPIVGSSLYTSPITVQESTTIKAIGVKEGMTDSSVASATYTISEKPEPGTVATPTFSPEGGTYSNPQMVSINSETSGATIYYTTDGNDPTTESATYSSAITVNETTTIKAIAVKDGMTNSAVASATFTISDEPEPEPGEETKVDVEDLSDSDISDELKGQGYDSVESIEGALETALSLDTEEQKEQSQLVDVKLMISTDGGATWSPATPANFPAGGIDVVLPYPAGTNGNDYSFSVAHMVGTTAKGMTAGDIEKPGTTNTSSGISTHFNGLSPVLITWTKKSSPSGKDTSEEEKAHTHHYVWETIEATEENDGELRYVCDICGAVQTRVPITAYYVFNKNTTEKIRKAAQGTTVKIETSKWISFHKMVIEALRERPDVTLEISFLSEEYKGDRYVITIPAGSDLSNLIDENGFVGFLYLGGKYGIEIR